jgi:toxin-antitoxin system PIN domain toxin
MILPDVNVLVYAFRPGSARHDEHRHWLSTLIGSREPFAISDEVLASVVRITTDRRINADPDPLEDALDYVESLRGQPRAVTVRPGARHWTIFNDICRASGAVGGAVSDAWLAALALEHGCELATADQGFARYPYVRFFDPLRA